MKIHCQDEVFDRFSGASIHGVVFGDLQLFTDEHAARWREKTIRVLADSQLTLEQLTATPAVSEWRRAYQSLGLKPSKYRSSVEQLYRRALNGHLIETPLPLVNLYCYVSLLCSVPMGAYDLSKLRGDVVVRNAQPGESFSGIGDKQETAGDERVIIYADEAGIICWAWNYRDAERTRLDTDTRRAVFFADSSIEESRGRAESAITMLSAALSEAGCEFQGQFVLDRSGSLYSQSQDS